MSEGGGSKKFGRRVGGAFSASYVRAYRVCGYGAGVSSLRGNAPLKDPE